MKLFILTIYFLLPLSGGINSKTIHPFVDKTIASIPVGEHSEATVFKLYGRGVYIAKDDAICYYNKKEKNFLIVWYGEDKIIASVTIVKEGYENNWGQCKKKKIYANLETGKGIKLNDSLEKIIKIYGEPIKREMKDGVLTLYYNTDYTKDPQVLLFYDVILNFKNGRLVELFIHDGD